METCGTCDGEMGMRRSEPFALGGTQADRCAQSVGVCGELLELMGSRLFVDVLSRACDRERDVRGR